MSDHTSTLVPIESWCYLSPELRHKGKHIDIGVFAEALIYYDRVFVIPTNEVQFAEFVSWFVKQDKYSDFIALLKDGIINFYYYAFISTAVKHEGMYHLMNIQDEEQARAPVFEQRFLTRARLEQFLPHARQRARLYQAISGRVVEVKAEEFGAGVKNAEQDYRNPERAALIVQALLDEVYPILGLRQSPIVTCKVIENSGKTHLTWNVNFDQVSQALGKDLNFHLGTPFTGAVHCNRLLWSAAKMGCDLYLNSPMSTLAGDKLYECGERLTEPGKIIESLSAEVEFPNIRQLVNSGQIDLGEVLEFRKKGARFRKWLQDESERDRNAIIAYHNEVAQDSGWDIRSRRSLRLFGRLGAAAGGVAIGGAIAGSPGAIIGAVVGEGIKYVIDVACKLGEDWRPVVFGNWVEDKIRKTHSRPDRIQ
jgi:hypothetical protein